MRIPVFSAASNPNIDKPIQRKSHSFACEQVRAARADWVDVANPSRGIVCRKLLYFGEKKFIPEKVDSGKMPPAEVEGLRFKGPRGENSQIPRSRFLPRHREVYGKWQLEVSLLEVR